MKHTKEEMEAILVPDKIKQLDIACRKAIDSFGHWTVGPMVFDKAKADKVKSKAVVKWIEDCWTQYYMNKAMLEGGAPFNEVMLVYPVSPHTAKEIMAEV